MLLNQKKKNEIQPIQLSFASVETKSDLTSNIVWNCDIEQVLATTPHETPTIRTLAPHHENYTS